MLRVDAHHHFWRYSEEEFAWLDGELTVLRMDFLPEDLKPLLDRAGVISVVTVQARQTLQETDWLLSLAGALPWVAGVVGWLPMREPAFPELLEQYARSAKLKALRHVIQAEPAGFMDDATFRGGLSRLEGAGLTYDLLITESQLGEAIRLVDAFPRQVFVVDHIGKPRIREGLMSPWSSQIAELAKRPNVFCKVSGMVTEAGANWRSENLKDFFEVVLSAFTPYRLLAGTDWPVVEAHSGYGEWWNLLAEWTAKLSPEEQAAVMGLNAASVYRLAVEQNV